MVSTSDWDPQIGSAKVARDSRCHVGKLDWLLTSRPDDKTEDAPACFPLSSRHFTTDKA
jgi:hypothetical protein